MTKAEKAVVAAAATLTKGWVEEMRRGLVADGTVSEDCANALCDLALVGLAARNAEPVAWMEQDIETGDFSTDDIMFTKPFQCDKSDGYIWVPLFAAPKGE